METEAFKLDCRGDAGWSCTNNRDVLAASTDRFYVRAIVFRPLST